MQSPRRRRLPPLNWLRAFEAAARHLSFTEAGEELGVSQAAVSQQVRQLEDWLGTQLFKRLPRALALTDAGIAYLPIVRDGIERIDLGTTEIFGRPEGRPVTLRATATLAALWLAPMLARFRAEHPDVAVRVTTLYAPVDFGQDGVDIEIRYGAGAWPGVKAHRLFDESFYPVASPAYLAAAPPLANPADLPRHRLIHTIGEREGWGAYLRQAGVAAADPPEGLQCDSLVVALNAAAAGAGVALATSPVTDSLMAASGLVDLFGRRWPARLAHHLVVPETADPAREVALLAGWLLARK
jgi:LysR family transcriptional regulator, glycine cleavage system transcriptional activator